MEARVKQTCVWPKIQSCAGVEFLKEVWAAVPAGREAEAKANPFLETRKAPAAPKPKAVEPDEPAAEVSDEAAGTD